MNAALDRLPPADIDAERAVISAAFLRPELAVDALAVLKADNFFLGSHREVWLAIERLHEQEAKIDIVTVAGRLRDAGKLEQIGGTRCLADLTDAVPAVANLDAYIKLVLDKWRLRTLMDVCRTAVAEAYGDVDDVDAFLANLGAQIDAIVQEKTEQTQVVAKDSARQEVVDYDARKRGAAPGIPTGIKALDRKIGGLKRAVPHLVAARPGIGKTGFLCSMSAHVASTGLGGVAIFSLEMPRDQLTQRLIAQLAQLDTQEIDQARLSANDYSAYTIAAERLGRLPIVIDDASVQTPRSIRAATRKARSTLQRDYGVGLALVVVDYIQKMGSDGKKKNTTRDEDVSESSESLRKLAKEFHCPVVVLSQLNRKCEDRPDKRPILSDLRESGSLEQDAFSVIMLYREDYYRKDSDEPTGEAELIVRKLRQGGSTGPVKARFHAPSAGFSDLIEAHNYFDSI